jgi:phosphoglycerate dehydrogenase-like enzyme
MTSGWFPGPQAARAAVKVKAATPAAPDFMIVESRDGERWFHLTADMRPSLSCAPATVVSVTVWIAHEQGRAYLGDLPADLEVLVLPGVGEPMPGDPAEVTFWVPPFLAAGDVVEFATRLPRVEVIQLLSAGADAWTGRVPEGVILCDARGVHDSSTAEWVLTAILASLRRFDYFAQAQAAGRWSYGEVSPTDELAGKRVLIIGAGSIGTAVARRLEPFDVSLTLVARTARAGVHGIAELPGLLPQADVVVLLVPLTEQTRGLADAGFFAALPDGALFVNAARGPVADTTALAEAAGSGRIFAALDVTDPEPLPAGHPLWLMPNVLITPHVAGSVRGLLSRAYRLAGEQLRRHLAGAPLGNVVQDGY